MSKALLITGATGKQGGAVVNALLASPNATEFLILGVTRDSNSSSSQKLKAKSPNIKLVQGNLNDVPSLFKTAVEVAQQPIWGLFSVQIPMGQGQSTATEEAYGKALVDEAIKSNVNTFVYTSVDRGGNDKSWNNPTNVPHFISKHNVELYLRDSATNSSMSWTILRPTAFMDNIAPGFPGKIFLTAWRDALGDTPLQLIATKDIGILAAKAFMSEEYRGKAIGLAGDTTSFAQLNDLFQKQVGYAAPTTFSFFASLLLWAVSDVGLMMKWFKTDGYGVDTAQLRTIHPELLDLETWFKNESNFETR